MGPYRRHLEVIHIERPCPESWDAMEGDGPMRFCGICQQNVYDLSELTAQESAELLAMFEGPACVRLLRRGDGTLVSSDCGDLRARAKRRRVIKLMATGAATVGLVATTFGAAQMAAPSAEARARCSAPHARSATTHGVRSVMGEYTREMGERVVISRPAFEGSWIDPSELSLDPPDPDPF